MTAQPASGWVRLLLAGLAFLSIRPPASATLLVQVGRNFAGSTYGVESVAQPPDTEGAVGPSHFVELINGRFSVYAKSDGRRLQTMTDVTFWNRAGVTFSPGLDVTDPRVVYDAYSQRWFASEIDFNPSAFRLRGNRFLLAVSASPDPAGAWHGFAFAADPINGDFADFPTLGVDADGVYLSGDMTSRAGVNVGSALVAIPKSGLMQNPPTIAGRTSLGIQNANVRGAILQPAVAMGAATTGELVLGVGNLGYDNQSHSTLVASALQNVAVAGGASLAGRSVLTVPPYLVSSYPTQPDGSNNLDNGDNRFSSMVRRVGDVLYAAHCVQANNRAAIRWYMIDAVNRTLLQTGTITDNDLDLIYPSIAANEAGTVVIGCNGTSATVYLGSYALVGEMIGDVLTFGKPMLLKAGLASYQNTDTSGNSRWGDYSATSVDPADPTHFWTIQAYPPKTTAWRTQITEIIATPLRLTISATAGNVTLSWPAAAAGFQLQSTSDLSATGLWQPIDQTPVLAGDLATVVLPNSANLSFFRLVQP